MNQLKSYIYIQWNGKLFDLPCTELNDTPDRSIDSSNNNALLGFEEKHSGFSITLKYRKNDRRRTDDDPVCSLEFHYATLTWDEEVILHNVTCRVIVFDSNIDGYLAYLTSTNISLRLFHVIEIVIRGFIQKCCSLTLSSVEEACLGDVTGTKCSNDMHEHKCYVRERQWS